MFDHLTAFISISLPVLNEIFQNGGITIRISHLRKYETNKNIFETACHAPHYHVTSRLSRVISITWLLFVLTKPSFITHRRLPITYHPFSSLDKRSCCSTTDDGAYSPAQTSSFRQARRKKPTMLASVYALSLHHHLNFR